MLIYFLYGVHFSVGYKNLESEPTFNQDDAEEESDSNENHHDSNVNRQQSNESRQELNVWPDDDNESVNRTNLDVAKTVKSYYTAKVDRVQIDLDRMA